jgi:hypothetical protein
VRFTGVIAGQFAGSKHQYPSCETGKLRVIRLIAGFGSPCPGFFNRIKESLVVAAVFMPGTSKGDLDGLVNIILNVSPSRRLIASFSFTASRTPVPPG